MVTEAQVLAAFLAAANAALPASVRAYEPPKVPSPKPNEFVSVTIVRRSGGSPRSGRYETTGWSVYVMAASSAALSSGTNARNCLRLIGDAVENKPLVVGDEVSTPVRFDNGRPVAPDNNWSTGVNTYSFAI